MFASFNDIFNKKKQSETLLKVLTWVENDILLNGEACINCNNAVYVQVTPYYDCICCKKNKTIEIPQNERGIRCDDYQKVQIEVDK